MRIFLLAAAALHLSFAPAAHAAEDPYQRLVDALAGEDRLLGAFDQSMRNELSGEFQRDGDMVEMEEECPGMFDVMADTMLPVLHRSQERSLAEYRASLLALFRKNLTADHAREAADFYMSDNGRALVRLSEETVDVSRSLEEIRDTEDMIVSEATFAADKQASEAAMKSKLEPILAREVGMELAGAEWLLAMMPLKPQMQTLELALMNADTTEEEDATVEAALDDALERHFVACYAEDG